MFNELIELCRRDSMHQLLSTVISLVPDSANTLAVLLIATHAPAEIDTLGLGL